MGSDQALAKRPMEGCRLGLLMSRGDAPRDPRPVQTGARLMSFATTTRLSPNFWTKCSRIGKKAKGTLSSCCPNSRPTGGQPTGASRRTTDTKTGNGFSPGLRKTPHGRLSTGAIDDAAVMHHATLAPCKPAHAC